MQDYIGFAEKNGVALKTEGACQFCGADTTRGVHECLEIFNFGFDGLDLRLTENHIYKFLVVDAHALQHSEIHGRWSNHFHITRLCLILEHQVEWTYQRSPVLSNVLNRYKVERPSEILSPPPILQRGNITTIHIKQVENDPEVCKQLIRAWAETVYDAWEASHWVARKVADQFLSNS